MTRAAVGAGLLAGAWAALQRPSLQRVDVRIGDALRRSHAPAVDRVVVHTTDLGSVYAVMGMAAALATLGRRRQALDVLAVGGLTWTVSQASKTRVGRQRPYEQDGTRRLIRPPTGSSFPSGHAAVGMALMSLAAQEARGPVSRRSLYGVGSYVAASRVYAGVHYPTDVIGGAGIGLLAASLWRGRVAAVGRAITRFVLRLPFAVGRIARGTRWPITPSEDRAAEPRAA